MRLCELDQDEKVENGYRFHRVITTDHAYVPYNDDDQ